jgi:hypothetical protein
MLSVLFRPFSWLSIALLFAGCLPASGAADAQVLPASLIPDDTAIAAYFPVSNLMTGPGFDAVRANLPQNGAALDQPLNPNAKLTLADLESVLVAADASGKNYVLIVTLREDSNEDQFKIGVDDKSETVGDYNLYDIGGDRSACLVDGRTLLIGPPETVRTIMGRPNDAEIAAPLAEAWTAAGRQPAYAVASGGMIGKQAASLVPAAFPAADVFAKMQTVTATLKMADPVAVTATIRCADASAAAQLKGLVDVFSVIATTAPAGDPKALVQSATATVAGSTLTVRATLDVAGTFRVLDAALKPGMGDSD